MGETSQSQEGGTLGQSMQDFAVAYAAAQKKKEEALARIEQEYAEATQQINQKYGIDQDEEPEDPRCQSPFPRF